MSTTARFSFRMSRPRVLCQGLRKDRKKMEVQPDHQQTFHGTTFVALVSLPVRRRHSGAVAGRFALLPHCISGTSVGEPCRHRIYEYRFQPLPEHEPWSTAASSSPHPNSSSLRPRDRLMDRVRGKEPIPGNRRQHFFRNRAVEHR
jgi:hypothetical protein